MQNHFLMKHFFPYFFIEGQNLDLSRRRDKFVPGGQNLSQMGQLNFVPDLASQGSQRGFGILPTGRKRAPFKILGP